MGVKVKLSELNKKIQIKVGSIVKLESGYYTKVVKIENGNVYGWWVSCIDDCRTDDRLGYGIELKKLKLVK